MKLPSQDHPVDILVEHAIEHRVPLGMQIDLTYRCDLSCRHCYLRDRARRELTIDEYDRLLGELAELGTLFVVFSGGDIFVRPDACEILRLASQDRFCVRLISHCQSITDPVADELAELALNRAYVSVYHARPEIHDGVTGIKGSHARTLAGIRRLRARGIPVTVKCPVFKNNSDAAESMPELVAALGADLDLSVTIRAANDGSTDLVDLNLDREDAARTSCVALDLCDARAGTATRTEPRARPWGERVCLAAHTSAYIGPDGTVQPCLDYEVSCGSVREQSFHEIWFGSAVLNYLRTLRRADFKDCAGCKDLAWCRLCPAHALSETGSPTGVAPSSCREARVLEAAVETRNPRGAR